MFSLISLLCLPLCHFFFFLFFLEIWLVIGVSLSNFVKCFSLFCIFVLLDSWVKGYDLKKNWLVIVKMLTSWALLIIAFFNSCIEMVTGVLCVDKDPHCCVVLYFFYISCPFCLVYTSYNHYYYSSYKLLKKGSNMPSFW